jgi:hypothetical protein
MARAEDPAATFLIKFLREFSIFLFFLKLKLLSAFMVKLLFSLNIEENIASKGLMLH